MSFGDGNFGSFIFSNGTESNKNIIICMEWMNEQTKS